MIETVEKKVVEEKIIETKENISPKPKKENFWYETIKFIVISALIVLPIRMFIAEPFIVSGSSMDPTFQNGQYLIVDKVTYELGDPKRGDVIIFKYPLDPSKYYIKRIIGLPGETVTMTDTKISIKQSDGQKIDWPEPYITYSIPQNFTKTLPEEQYFVLGDNRPASSDSRIWGTLPRKNIVGRPLFRLLPVGKIGILPGEEMIKN